MDKYDKAIEAILTPGVSLGYPIDLAVDQGNKNVDILLLRIYECWNMGHRDSCGPDHPARLLFGSLDRNSPECCLTQARLQPSAIELTVEQQADLAKDERIPASPMPPTIHGASLTPDSLLAFAEWQRRLDADPGKLIR